MKKSQNKCNYLWAVARTISANTKVTSRVLKIDVNTEKKLLVEAENVNFKESTETYQNMSYNKRKFYLINITPENAKMKVKCQMLLWASKKIDETAWKGIAESPYKVEKEWKSYKYCPKRTLTWTTTAWRRMWN